MKHLTSILFAIYFLPRCHIVFGVNAATKCLERDQLDLVIVCRSAKPPILTGHLLTLAACRGVPALALSGLSETLSKMMKARAIIAVGFKVSDILDLLLQ